VLPQLSKLSLKWQCLLVVALLLVGELTFVGILAYQLNATKQEVAREKSLKEILKRSQRLVFLLNDYEHMMELWVANRDPELERKSVENEKEMNKIAKWLQKHVTSKDMKRQIDGLAELQGKMFLLINKVKEKVVLMEQREAFTYAQGFYAKIRDFRWNWEHSAVNVIKEQEDTLKTFPEQHAERRKSIKNIVFVGCVGNIFMVLALSVFLWRTVVSRLLLMVDNTNLISLKKPMHARIEGSNEISDLDRELHDMADAIDAAQNERQAFLAMVSHELRTPLAAVSLSFELMGMGVAGEISAESERHVKDSEAKLKLLLKLINDLLDLEKLEAGKLVMTPKVVYIEHLLEDVTKQLKDLATQKQIVLDVPESMVELELDPDRMRQAVANILHNAITVSESGATVSIKLIESDTTVEIQILDEGGGVPAELREQIFERFRSTSSGLLRGMGLPIARRIVLAHDGEIGYSVRENGGSCFWIRLNLPAPVTASSAA
jgi:signal transduction histidine kinase